MEELKTYIKNNFNITISKVSYLEKNLKNLNKNFVKNYSFIKLKSSKLFRVYLLYLFVLASLLSIYFIYKGTQLDRIDELSQLNKKMQEIKSKNLFNPVTPILMKVFVDVKKNNLTISKFHLRKNEVTLQLKCKNKKQVFDMLDSYKNTKVNSIVYDEKGNEYIVDASFKIIRK